MKGKKKHIDDEFIPEAAAPDDMDLEDAEEVAEDKLKKLRDELKACQKEKQDNLDGWQRERADFLNYKRRAGEEKEREREVMQKRFIEKLLPLADSFDQALADPSWQTMDGAWKSGIEATRTQLARTFAELGVEEITAEGKDFNPHEHEAVSHDGEGDTVTAVLQKGYRVGTTIIRPARVVVGAQK